MTDLSPQAQAVLDAAYRELDYAPRRHVQWVAAAVLRAAAYQVLLYMEEPDWGACNEMQCDIELYADHQRKRAQLLAIAAELNGKGNG